jgi:hypothetical protein
VYFEVVCTFLDLNDCACLPAHAHTYDGCRTHSLPVEKVCERLKKKDSQICGLVYGASPYPLVHCVPLHHRLGVCTHTASPLETGLVLVGVRSFTPARQLSTQYHPVDPTPSRRVVFECCSVFREPFLVDRGSMCVQCLCIVNTSAPPAIFSN